MARNIADDLMTIGYYLEETEADFKTYQAWYDLRDKVTRLMGRVLQLQQVVKEGILNVQDKEDGD